MTLQNVLDEILLNEILMTDPVLHPMENIVTKPIVNSSQQAQRDYEFNEEHSSDAIEIPETQLDV
jgi:hypothetical protein